MKEFRRYLGHQGASEGATRQAWEILAEWLGAGIRLWPLGQSNRRSQLRFGAIIANAIDGQSPVRFFAPTCPDYPLDSRTGKLGVGVPEATRPSLSAVGVLVTTLKRRGTPFQADILLADTEIDLPEVVSVLTGTTAEDFLRRCRRSVKAIRRLVPEGVRVSTFSEFFREKHCVWCHMQYFWEEVVRQRMAEDRTFDCWLRTLAWNRQEKYESQLGRRMTVAECIRMAVRHYAQYSAFGYWMRQWDGAVFVNTDSPNLRAVGAPIVLSNPPDFLPAVKDQRQRIPVVVP